MSRSLLELDEFLVGHWDFENDFKDKSGNGNDGVPTNIEWKPTARGMKPKFNGSSSQIDISKHNDLVDEISVSLYVRIDNTSVLSMLYESGFSAGNYGIAIYSTPSGFTSSLNGALINYATSHIGKYVHIVLTYENGVGSKLYLNGIYVGSGIDKGAINRHASYGESFGVRNDASTWWLNGYEDDARIYSIALDADEVLTLYNSTKDGHGVLSYERSYTHRLSPDIDDSTVFATDMHTKNSDGTLVDLSGHSNHGTINGAVRTGGYFTDGMRFDGVDDHVGATGIAFSGEYTLESLIAIDESASSFGKLMEIGTANDRVSLMLKDADNTIYAFTKKDGVTYLDLDASSALQFDVLHHVAVCVTETQSELYIDGDMVSSIEGDYRQSINGNIELSRYLSDVGVGGWMKCNYLFACVHSAAIGIESRFNSLAVLPIYSCEFRSMPSNTTVYTDALPYSSAVINSGSFKLDDGLTCVTDGQLTLRCAHEFDGSEYVKANSGGVITANTGYVKIGSGTSINPMDTVDGISGSDTFNHQITTVAYKEGSGALTFTKGTLTVEGIVTYNPVADMDLGNGVVSYWVYIKDQSVLDKLESATRHELFIFDTDGDWIRWTLDLSVGWNYIEVEVDKPTSEVGTFDASIVDSIRFDFNTNNTTDTFALNDIVIDDMRLYPKASITQGSPLITLGMKAGDTLDSLYVQFREEVGCPPLV